MTKTTNPFAKRHDETHAQWQLRLAVAKLVERPCGEPLVPSEATAHGDYADEFVTHVETNTRTRTTRNRQASSLAKLHTDGQLTAEQFMAALQIAQVAETIERAVSVRCASLEARVDNANASRDALVESLRRVRLEVAYRIWRERLPMPRRMIIDMVLADRALKVTARVYGLGWPRAKRVLVKALDAWSEVTARVWREVDESDMHSAYSRLQCAA